MTRSYINQCWHIIGSYMDDVIRETVHAECAPCTNEEFLDRYLEYDPDFAGLLDGIIADHEFWLLMGEGAQND